MSHGVLAEHGAWMFEMRLLRAETPADGLSAAGKRWTSASPRSFYIRVYPTSLARACAWQELCLSELESPPVRSAPPGLWFGATQSNTVSGAISRIRALRIRRYIGSSSKGPNHRGLRHVFFGAVPVDEPFFDIDFMIYLRDF
jgi:hypothetical protein